MAQLRDFDFLVIGLFRAPLETVRPIAERMVNESFGPGRIESHVDELDTSQVYVRRPPAGGAHLKRAVFFEPDTAHGTTALMANLEDGWVTLCNGLASRLPGEHVLVRSCNEDQYPLHGFEIWADGKSVRKVQALREDPDWEFVARGEPRAFEDVSSYEARPIEKRLDRKRLLDYLVKMGWDLRAPEFWISRNRAFYLFENPRGS